MPAASVWAVKPKCINCIEVLGNRLLEGIFIPSVLWVIIMTLEPYLRCKHFKKKACQIFLQLLLQT